MAACQEAAKPFTYFSLQIAGLISCLGDAFGGIRDNIQNTTSEGKGGKRAPPSRTAAPPRAKLA